MEVIRRAVSASQEFELTPCEQSPVHKIVENIYLGGSLWYPEGFYPDIVVSLAGELSILSDRVEHLQEEVRGDEVGVQQMMRLLPRIEALLRRALHDPNQVFFIHCAKGEVQSPAALACGLSLIGRCSFSEAYHLIRSVRRQVEVPCGQNFSSLMGQAFEERMKVMRRAEYYLQEMLSWEEGGRIESVINGMRKEILVAQGRAASGVSARLHHITHNFYLGGRHHLVDLLNEVKPEGENFESIITLCPRTVQTKLNALPKEIEHLIIPIYDHGTNFPDLLDGWEEIMIMVYKALKNNWKLLLHCHEGVSRSPTTLALVFAEITGLPYEICYAFIASIRPILPLRETYPEAYEEFAGTTTLAWLAKLYSDQQQRELN